MDISIRPLQATDWKKYRDMRLAALRENPKAYGISEADEASRADEEWITHCQDAQDGKGKWYSVAETSEGELVGMLGAIEVFGIYMRHQVEVTQAYVDPRFRRQRISERLFASLKTQLLKVDYMEQMIVWVTLHEDQVGMKMFEKFGFKLAGHLTKTVKYKGQYYDCCWLEASLRQ